MYLSKCTHLSLIPCPSPCTGPTIIFVVPYFPSGMVSKNIICQLILAISPGEECESNAFLSVFLSVCMSVRTSNKKSIAPIDLIFFTQKVFPPFSLSPFRWVAGSFNWTLRFRYRFFGIFPHKKCASPNWDANPWQKGMTVDTNSLRYLPRRSSKNCDLQFVNNDWQTDREMIRNAPARMLKISSIDIAATPCWNLMVCLTHSFSSWNHVNNLLVEIVHCILSKHV